METIIIEESSVENLPPDPQDGEASFTVYVCPREPPVLSDNAAHFRVDSSELTFYIRKENTPTNSIEVRILRDYLRYFDDLWKPSSSSEYVSWTRSFHELITGYEPNGTEKKEKVFEDNISIKFVPPSDSKYILRSYWKFTMVSARNPLKLTPHESFIVKVQRPLSEEFRIPNDQSRENFWAVSLSSHTHKESQPIVRPGEYIIVQWLANVNARDFLSFGFYGCKYETPLFTGGRIIEKWGGHRNTRYAVEIFGVAVCNIVPTDFFEFEVGKWCYLLKTKATIALDKEKQDFGSSGIQVADNGSFSGLIGEINSERRRNGRDSFYTNSFLEKAATQFSTEMKNNNVENTVELNYDDLQSRLEYIGYLDLLKPGSTFEMAMATFIYTRRRDDDDFKDSELFQTLLDILDFSNITYSTLYREIGISKTNDESKIGFTTFVKTYYTFIAAVRSDGLNVGCPINDDYRITPFNFEGPMTTEMAISDSYFHELRMDSASNFVEVFDMKKYEAEVKTVNYFNDTLSASFYIPLPDGSTALTEKTVPVFFHCGGEPITEGGSNAFTKGDKVVLQVPTDSSGESDWDNAHAIAHTEFLKSCYGPVIIVCSWSDCEAFAWDLEKQKPVVDYIKMTEPVGLINNATEFVKAKLVQLGFAEPQLMLHSVLEETPHFTETIEESPHGQPNAYHGNWVPQAGGDPLITPETMDNFDDSFQEELSLPALAVDNGDGTYLARAGYISVPEYLYHYDLKDLDKHYVFPDTEKNKCAYLWRLDGISDLDFIEAPEEPADPFLEAVSDRIRDSIIAEFEALNPDLLEMDDYSMFLDNRMFLFAHGLFDKEMWDYEKINAVPPLNPLPVGTERKLTGIKDNLFARMKQKISVQNTKIHMDYGVTAETPDVLMDTWRDAFPFISVDNEIATATLNDNSLRWLATEGCGIGQSKFHTVLYEAFYVCPKIVLTMEDGSAIDPDTNINNTIMTAGAPITKSLRFHTYIPNNTSMREDMLLSCINTYREIKNNPKAPEPVPDPLYMPFFITGELQRLAKEQSDYNAKIGEVSLLLEDGSSFAQRLEKSLYVKYCNPETGKYKAVIFCFKYTSKVNPFDIFKEWVIDTTEEGISFKQVLESRDVKATISDPLILGYKDIGISISEANDSSFLCLIFGYREHHWPGLSPVNTELLNQYIEEHMLFNNRSLNSNNDDGALKAPFFWYVPPKE